MGAVAALLYACEHQDKFACLVIDSSFCSIKKIFKDLVKKHKLIPKALAMYMYNVIRE